MSAPHRSRILREGPSQRWVARCRACGWNTSYSYGLINWSTRGQANWGRVLRLANDHYVEKCAHAVFAPPAWEPDLNAPPPERDF